MSQSVALVSNLTLPILERTRNQPAESTLHPTDDNSLDTGDACLNSATVRPMTRSDTRQVSDATGEAQIPEELALEIRRLAHDLSNSLEIIVQTGYLLGTANLTSPASDWLRMLDTGTAKALEINLALRNYIKAHTPS